MSLDQEELDELRNDMIQESRQEQQQEIDMRYDFDVFIDYSNAVEIIKSIESLIRVADEYGWDRSDIVDYIKENI